MSESMLVALGIVIGGVPALVTSVVMLFRTLHRNRQESRSRYLQEQNVTIRHLEKQIDRHEAQEQAQQATNVRLMRKLAICREALVCCQLQVTILHDYGKRQAQKLEDAGQSTEPAPAIPVLNLPGTLDEGEDEEFITRTQAASAKILAGVDAKLKKGLTPPPPTP